MLGLPTRLGRLWLWVGVALATACAPAPEPVDLLLVNGKILTLDDEFTVVSSLAVRDGRIVGVGDESLAGRFAAAEVVNLEGKTVMPGFIDSHTHIARKAAALYRADRGRVRSSS